MKYFISYNHDCHECPETGECNTIEEVKAWIAQRCNGINLHDFKVIKGCELPLDIVKSINIIIDDSI